MGYAYTLTGLHVMIICCPLVTIVYCEKPADSIEMPFGMAGRVGPKIRVSGGRAHWRHPANTVERLCAATMSGSTITSDDAASFKITFDIRKY